MAGEKFYLIFSEQPNKRVQINEPINYSEVDFVLERRKNGMGLDVSLSGGSVSFRFTLYRHGNSFDNILYYAHRYGFEANVKLVIVLENGLEYIGELDFEIAETNDFNYFECPVILESEMQIFRRRSETKVDLLSKLSTDNEVINPLVPINMLLQAKPTIQTSKWDQPSDFDKNLSVSGANTLSTAFFQINPCLNLVEFGINDTFNFFKDFEAQIVNDFTNSSFLALTAQSNLKNVVIEINDLLINLRTDVDNGGNGYAEFSLEIRHGSDFNTANKINLLPVYLVEKQSFDYNGNQKVIINSLNRGDNVWIFFKLKVRQSANPIFLTPRFECFTKISGMKTIITAESTAYNSIVPCFRLIDVMRQVAKSNSGMQINAPRYDVGGQFYDTVLTNGKMLGGNITDPFYISWDDLEKSYMPEHHGDSEIQLDKRVFVGIENDFYTNDECGFFNNTQFSGLNRKPNPIYMLNEFGFKYENYQSLKENTEPNSGSTIHGETKFTPFNKRVENSRDLSVKWIRDAILIDVQQRLSTKVSKDTATQDDDKIFAIDTVVTESDQKFTESTNLQHTFSNNQLSLRSDGSVNFLVLGIKSDTNFTIEYPDLNAGNYNVLIVTNTELVLSKIGGGAISSNNDGNRLTKYSYEIRIGTIPLTNRTNQGFDVVLNLVTPEKYSNLRYSVQRNIRNYWNQFLATVNIYHKDKLLKNTFYKNNALCETEYSGLRIIEKEDWKPDNPIVTPYMYEDVVFANVDFEKVISIWNQLRVKHGYIRTIDNNSRVLKLYPIKMSYENKNRQLTISGQEKFEKYHMTIVKRNGIITVNDETKLRKLVYDVEDGNKIVLFDLERQRLYNGVYWDKVYVNGAVPETLEILKKWLDLL